MSAGLTDAFVLKHGRGGAWRWTSQYGGTGNNYAAAIATGGGSQTFMIGHGGGSIGGLTNAGSDDVFAARFDSAGVLK